MRLSYRPQMDREGLDEDGYENLEFYADFLDEEELAEIVQVLREKRLLAQERLSGSLNDLEGNPDDNA
ncbi:MAG: hypothetical protein C4327_15060 [Meiothermus sp.]